MATFISLLTGGSALLIKDQNWNVLSSTIKAQTYRDIEEIKVSNSAFVQLDSEINNFKPDDEYYHANLNILKQIPNIFDENIDLSTRARLVRAVYTNGIRNFLSDNNPKKNLAELPSVSRQFKQKIIEKRGVKVNSITAQLDNFLLSPPKPQSQAEKNKELMDKAHVIKELFPEIITVNLSDYSGLEFRFDMNDHVGYRSFVNFMDRESKEVCVPMETEDSLYMLVYVPSTVIQKVDISALGGSAKRLTFC
jgi:hypothetical protein